MSVGVASIVGHEIILGHVRLPRWAVWLPDEATLNADGCAMMEMAGIDMAFFINRRHQSAADAGCIFSCPAASYASFHALAWRFQHYRGGVLMRLSAHHQPGSSHRHQARHFAKCLDEIVSSTMKRQAFNCASRREPPRFTACASAPRSAPENEDEAESAMSNIQESNPWRISALPAR